MADQDHPDNQPNIVEAVAPAAAQAADQAATDVNYTYAEDNTAECDSYSAHGTSGETGSSFGGGGSGKSERTYNWDKGKSADKAMKNYYGKPGPAQVGRCSDESGENKYKDHREDGDDRDDRDRKQRS